MRNLDIADSRNKLEQYAARGQFGLRRGLIGELAPGGAAAIAAISLETETSTASAEALDHAAIESGTD
jgi:argininosuccinate synthase